VPHRGQRRMTGRAGHARTGRVHTALPGKRCLAAWMRHAARARCFAPKEGDLTGRNEVTCRRLDDVVAEGTTGPQPMGAAVCAIERATEAHNRDGDRVADRRQGDGSGLRWRLEEWTRTYTRQP
jgi:hypothetical protein